VKKKTKRTLKRASSTAAETITISLTLSVDKLSKNLSGGRGRKLLEDMHEALHSFGIVAHSGNGPTMAEHFKHGFDTARKCRVAASRRRTAK
jgi:hypothetical protein